MRGKLEHYVSNLYQFYSVGDGIIQDGGFFCPILTQEFNEDKICRTLEESTTQYITLTSDSYTADLPVRSRLGS